MLGDDGRTRGDISPGETGSGEGSGTDFTDFLTGTYTSESDTTIEGSGTGSDYDFTTESGITEITESTESGGTEETVDGSTETTVESTEGSTVSGGRLMKSFFAEYSNIIEKQAFNTAPLTLNKIRLHPY